ncbi:hypothetical protein PHISCL_01762 [Aspergillus sclerotialis]|uniref:Uncharacterized protein n=1 Tax=Aspergillus sclerotialis TaxID=2070753 RepID=A0A3A2ZT59_9EURO|nr:hypothetical protein PHISCL_01762 [Aspergillus sclerotialis]
MFEVPNAKRVCRGDIDYRSSSPPSSPPCPETEFQDGRERLRKLLNLDDVFTTAPPIPAKESADEPGKDDKQDEDEEQEFEFRLFNSSTRKPEKRNDGPAATGISESTQRNTNGQAQKLRIKLRSPTPGPVDPSEGRFVRPFRGWEYYFTTPDLLSSSLSAPKPAQESLNTEKRKQFEDAAVSGLELMGWANKPWPGCHLPWRVIHLKARDTKGIPESKSAPIYVVDPAARSSPKSRKKPGKKRRAQLRKRASVAEKKKQSEAEKRNRKNRERKIKRRQKAREMKAASVVQEDASNIPIETGEGSLEGGDD